MKSDKNELRQHNPRIELLNLSMKRRVPLDTFMEWLEILRSLGNDDAKDAYAEKMLAYVEQNYPVIPVEQILKEADEAQDWENFRYDVRLYWDDIPSMLPDAVRIGAHHLVAEIAPHCLFNNWELQTEYLSLAPDKATRKALTDHVMIGRDSEYEKYPFSCVYNQIHHKLDLKTISCNVLSMQEGLQEKVWRRFLQQAMHKSTEGFFRLMTHQEIIDSQPMYIRTPEGYEHFLFDMGYEMTPTGFVQRALPDYWINSEYSQIWSTEAERTNAGLVGMLVLLRDLGWEVIEDRIINHFGCTGYSYLKEI